MTPQRIRKFVIALRLLTTVALPGQEQSVGGAGAQQAASSPAPALNPVKIAPLHWYLVNTAAPFPVGSQPYGVAFDGANIWSANYGDGTVTKLCAADGTVLGTFKVGNGPAGVTFDGGNIWITNSFDNTVTKLRASDGKVLGTFNVGKSHGGSLLMGQTSGLPPAEMARLRS